MQYLRTWPRAALEVRSVFRTNSGTKLAAAVEHEALGFEVDNINFEHRTGWRALVVGMSTVATNPAQIQNSDRAGIDR